MRYLNSCFGVVILAVLAVSPISPVPAIAIWAAPVAATPSPKRAACERPPDDYTRITLAGQSLNQRTLWMLQLARALYRGPGDVMRLTQGSYVDSLSVSFGTHAGGGAVDISIRARTNNKVLSEVEAGRMIKALRQAGFAAWLRRKGDLKVFDGAHIHAIAIGDRELSDAARAQLDGPEGYFRGLDGVPPAEGGPQKDRYNGPFVCPWMTEFDFRDLR